MALKMELQQQKEESDKLVQHLVAHVSRLSNRTRPGYHQHHTNNLSGGKHHMDLQKPTSNYPPWMVVPPTHPAETKLVDRKIYTWCTKCRQGQGLWVCRHNTETHVDGYTPQCNTRRRVDFETPQVQNGRPHKDGTHSQRFRSDHHRQVLNPAPASSQNVAQLSLLDYLDEYLPTNESHADDGNMDQFEPTLE
jgi:hypothetical protein